LAFSVFRLGGDTVKRLRQERPYVFQHLGVTRLGLAGLDSIYVHPDGLAQQP